MGRCAGFTKAGKRCRRLAMKGRKYCRIHSRGKRLAEKKRRESPAYSMEKWRKDKWVCDGHSCRIVRG